MIALVRSVHSLVLALALLGAMVFGSVRQGGCSMHGLGAAGQAHGPAHGAAAHAHHAASGVERAHGHDAPADGDGHGPCHCTCIGDCTAPAQTATVPVTPTMRVALVVAEPHRLPDAEPDALPPTEPDRLLPFANGPPTIA